MAIAGDELNGESEVGLCAGLQLTRKKLPPRKAIASRQRAPQIESGASINVLDQHLVPVDRPSNKSSNQKALQMLEVREPHCVTSDSICNQICWRLYKLC